MRILYRVVWIGSLLSILAMTFLFLKQPLALSTLAPMKAYAAADKSLTFQYPGNWKPQEAASQGIASQVSFDPNATTHFAVISDLVGSLMGDVAKSAPPLPVEGMPGLPAGLTEKQKSPLETLHEMDVKLMGKNKTRYPEFEAGATQPSKVSGMDALVTDFTFKKGNVWGAKEMVGMRVTVLAPDRQITILGTCAKENEKAMMATFDQIIGSMHFGPTGG